MKALQINGNKARSLYPTASNEFRAMLEDSFGKDFFFLKITDRVKSIEDACAIEGIALSSVLSSYDTEDISSIKKLKVVNRVLNEGWRPDWNDSNQHKYEPVFIMKDGELVFDDVDDWSQYSRVGSRLCYKSSALAEYAGKTFITDYRKAIL